MFKVNNKDTRMTPNNEDTRTSVSVISVSIINFEHAMPAWLVFMRNMCRLNPCMRGSFCA